MKSLYVADILSPIDGRILRGSKRSIIKHVVTSPKGIRDNTMYFNLDRGTLNPSLYSKNKSIVIITDRPYVRKQGEKSTVVKVKSIERAYWDFIRYYRSLFDIPVIGITGTCGKTTTTEMVKKILSEKLNVQSTIDGKNGLRMNLSYLLGIDEKTEAAVFEMGVLEPGFIKYSCEFFQPQIGVLLNIGVYHLRTCKTFENYFKAKTEILEGLKNKGTLIINGDDENIKKIDFSRFKGNIIKIGLSHDSHYRADNIHYTNEGTAFTLSYRDEVYPAFIKGYGKHNVYNALAAIAASHTANMPIKTAIKALATFKQVRQHLEFRKGINNITIIDDTWNCTPPSIKAALEVLGDIGMERKKVAVIGYMPQLGESGKGEYNKIGEHVVKTGVNILITIGDETKDIGTRALELGMSKNQVYSCHTGDQLYNLLQPHLNSDSIVLFKFPYKYRLRKLPSFRRFKNLIFI